MKGVNLLGVLGLLSVTFPDPPAKCLKPCINKCFFYSFCVDCITKLHQMFGFLSSNCPPCSPILSPANVLTSLTLPPITSSSYSKRNRPSKSGEWVALTLPACSTIDSLTNKEKRHWVSSATPRQGHYPHNNKRQPQSVIDASLNNSTHLYIACAHLASKLASMAHYYARASHWYSCAGIWDK